MKKITSSLLVSLLVSGLTLATYHFAYVLPQQQRFTQGSLTAGQEGDPAATPVLTRLARLDSQVSVREVPDFKNAASVTMPAVVHIKSKKTFSGKSYRSVWDEFFGYGGREGQGSRTVSTGSGVIIQGDGYIVTNNHVIADADELEVTLFDNRSFSAKVIGTDPTTDLGLIKIEGENLPAIAMANSDKASVGEWVLAVGNPFNLASTATAGIVSAIGRDLEIIKDGQSMKAIESFIQTDAAVNPGNSGGALVNLQGQLLGINTAIASPTGAYAGYAFAVPANIVKKVVGDLKSFGTVQRAYLGVVEMDNLNSQLAKELNLDITEGVYVKNLYEDGGANKAGIRNGDVIVAVNGIRVKNEAKLLELIARNRPGDEVEVSVKRRGDDKKFRVQLTDRYGNTRVEAPVRHEILSDLGVEFVDLSTQERNAYDINGGAKVNKLVAGKIRTQTEMQENFIITHANGNRIDSSDQLIQMLETSMGSVTFEGFYVRGRYLYEGRYTIEL